VNSEGPVNVWTVNPTAVDFVPPAAETPRVIVGASFTEITDNAFVTAALDKTPSFTTNVIVRAEVFGSSEVFR